MLAPGQLLVTARTRMCIVSGEINEKRSARKVTRSHGKRAFRAERKRGKYYIVTWPGPIY